MTYDVEIKYENSLEHLSSIRIIERTDGKGSFRRRKKALEYALDKLTETYKLTKKCDQVYYYIKPDGEAYPIFVDLIDSLGFEDKKLAEENMGQLVRQWVQTETITEADKPTEQEAVAGLAKAKVKREAELKELESHQLLTHGDLEKFKGEILAEVGKLIDDKFHLQDTWITAKMKSQTKTPKKRK